jgi:hypothetical protein
MTIVGHAADAISMAVPKNSFSFHARELATSRALSGIGAGDSAPGKDRWIQVTPQSRAFPAAISEADAGCLGLASDHSRFWWKPAFVYLFAPSLALT